VGKGFIGRKAGCIMSNPRRVSVGEFMALLARIPNTEAQVEAEELRQDREEFRDTSHYWMTLRSVTPAQQAVTVTPESVTHPCGVSGLSAPHLVARRVH
jgi:hypothetical protein